MTADSTVGGGGPDGGDHDGFTPEAQGLTVSHEAIYRWIYALPKGEGDLIVGKNGATAAATLVERPSRYAIICALPRGKQADGLADVLIDAVHRLPEQVRGSLTWDKGSEMARHAALTLATDLPVYLAHSHSRGNALRTRTPMA